jgi:cytochrome oxidase Cu insertion factor (SCO1/SenC/PrrC family)
MRFPILPLVALVCLTACSKKAPEIKYGMAPDFNLTERSNRKVTRQDLAGKVWVADFIFTRCAGACPIMSSNMRKLQDQLFPDIRLVSFSVDPYHDTPEVLTEYANRYGADRDRWLFLTGDPETVQKLSVGGFKLALDPTSGTEKEPITHSSRIVLVDREANIRGYYGTEEPKDLDRLIKDANNLALGTR